MDKTEHNWLSLYITIVYYREISIKTAMDVEQGLYKLTPGCIRITPPMVRLIIKRMDNPLFSNIGKLETDMRICRRVMRKIYLLCKLDDDLTDEDIQRNIDMVERGIPVSVLCRITHNTRTISGTVSIRK